MADIMLNRITLQLIKEEAKKLQKTNKTLLEKYVTMQ